MGEKQIERLARKSAVIAGAMNALGACLCSSAMGALAPDERDRFLKHMAREHLPALLGALRDRADLRSRSNLARRIRAGLGGDRRTIAEIAERGLDRDSTAEARALRLAIRNILLAVGVPLPAQAEGPCELHGASCPVPGEG